MIRAGFGSQGKDEVAFNVEATILTSCKGLCHQIIGMGLAKIAFILSSKTIILQEQRSNLVFSFSSIHVILLGI
jgi:hypothetical protein